MTLLHVVSTRGGLVESSHRVSAAVVRADGSRLAQAGNPDLVTFWRSAAKPFQTMPLVADGAADRWHLSTEELALVCGSHSSEAEHLRVVDGLLQKIGCQESDLACGGHAPLSAFGARHLASQGIAPTARWSNCSGKHAGMLALARHHGWPHAGYQQGEHPVQQRIAQEIARWAGMGHEEMGRALDGCGVQTFALPLHAMATAYARFGVSTEVAATRLREAMIQCPFMVAGTGRLCTDLIEAAAGGIIAKVGAEGVYSASLPLDGIGIALKVEDGDMRSAGPALLGLLAALATHDGLETPLEDPLRAVESQRTVPIRNTLGELTGALEPVGGLRFLT